MNEVVCEALKILIRDAIERQADEDDKLVLINALHELGEEVTGLEART